MNNISNGHVSLGHKNYIKAYPQNLVKVLFVPSLNSQVIFVFQNYDIKYLTRLHK